VSCPNCSAGEISPLTGRCELCGFTPEGHVAVQAPQDESVDGLAHEELAALFRLDNLLGNGVDSAVYAARERGSSRHIVIKVMPRPAEGRAAADDRFRRAVESVAVLEHPHIVPVFGHGWTEHLYWYTSERVTGRSLRDFLASRPPLDLKGCQRLVSQVAGALDYAHRRGVVHGALKPENVLVGAEGWVHVTDLLVRRALEQPTFPARPPRQSGGDGGVAAPSAPRIERSAYVAPEVVEDGLLTSFSDQYALAVLVTECLVGGAGPERGEPGMAPAGSLAAARPDLPPHVAHAVRRALSARPVDRFPGVLDFVAALEAYAPSLPDARPTGQSTSGVLLQTDWEPPDDPLRRRVVVGVIAVAVIVVLVLGLRPVVTRLLGGSGDRPIPAYDIEPTLDSTARSAGPGRRDGPPPVREPRRGPGTVAPPGTAVPGADPARVTTQRVPPGTTPGSTTPSATTPGAATPPGTPAVPAAGADAGHLFVNATPWGQLFVDGQLVGNTPKASLGVTPGRHTIRVVREGFAPFERTIQVAPGQTVRLTDIVLAELHQ
jgi:eukaryotic-like serine/threonine-protein kinase